MFTAVLSKDAQAALAALGKSGVVADAYLAGGSALALHFGHRRSEDFDFFSPHPFDPIQLGKAFSSVGTFHTEVAVGITLLGAFNGVKLSYFQYDYPLLRPTESLFDVAIAHPDDIAAMKLVAICDRSTKKDYVDLYTLAHRGVSFEAMFRFYEEKYHVFDENKFTITKSLTYFEPAEETEMPAMLDPLAWNDVKQFLIKESMRLGKQQI